MDVFDIYFLGDAVGPDADRRCVGEICIGSFREKFVSDVSFWPRARYEQQWLTAAMRIATTDRVAMVTSLSEPATSNFVRWWALYRNGDTIVLQDQVCFLDELREPFEPDRVEDYVRARETTSQDNQPISEWFTTIGAIAEFLKRRAKGHVPLTG